MKEKLNMIGQVFGRLTVEKFVGREDKHSTKVWLCHCVCGGTKEVTQGNLKQGHTKS